MKPGSIIHRYIFRELISPFVISLVFFMFVFLMSELVDITDYVVNYHVGVTTVLLLITYTIPFFIQFVIPMAVMIGVVLAFLKMSSDNEITALKAGGMSIYAMLPPVIVFCLMGCLISMFMSLYGEPWGRISKKEITKKLHTANIAALLDERKFNSKFSKDMMLYVTRINQDNSLGKVFIEYLSTSDHPITITAPRGRIEIDADSKVYRLLLEQGEINRVVDIETGEVSATSFNTLLLKRAMKSYDSQTDEEEMGLGELRDYIRSRKQKKDELYYLALIAFHSKFSLPFACLALGILAVPLGVQSKSARRPFGFGLGFFFILVYFLMQSIGESYGKTGIYPPIIGMWAPDILIGGIGIFLLVRCARERAIGIEWLLQLLHRKKPSHPDAGKNPSAPDTH